MLRRTLEGLKRLWLAALRERATPLGVAAAVAVGVFAGCTPLVGFHAGVALVLATVLRLNRLWAVVGSRVSFFPLLPWIALAEIQAGHRLRTGEWATLLAADAREPARQWLRDWVIGCVPVGLALGLALGVVAYALARRGDLTPRTPAPAPPPSSGSPR